MWKHDGVLLGPDVVGPRDFIDLPINWRHRSDIGAVGTVTDCWVSGKDIHGRISLNNSKYANGIRAYIRERQRNTHDIVCDGSVPNNESRLAILNDTILSVFNNEATISADAGKSRPFEFSVCFSMYFDTKTDTMNRVVLREISLVFNGYYPGSQAMIAADGDGGGSKTNGEIDKYAVGDNSNNNVKGILNFSHFLY